MVDNTPQLNIDRLPLVLAGPILRHTNESIVTVWVALRSPARVSLRVYDTLDCGQRIAAQVASGDRKTVTIGTSLHIVAIGARVAEGQSLQRGEIYAYDLEFSIGDVKYNLATALTSEDYPEVKIGYFPHDLPTFVLPPHERERVNIAHGSCRKPHGKGKDAVAILDRLLATNADTVATRPQQFFFTGDRIYGDDVAAPLLWVATHLGAEILGWEEELPIGTWDRPEYATPRELPSGNRGEIATKAGGFTAGLNSQRSKVTSHLFSLGEYCAAYLLALSPVVWPKYLPSAVEIGCRSAEVAAMWDRKVATMQSFIQSLSAVRRVMANIVTYTIFDDHDVSDDWNLNRAWCLRVLGKPLGRRVVSNALLAYSLFEAWGNTPDRFEPGASGYRLFGLMKKLIVTRGYDEAIEREIGRYVGLPPRHPRTNLPEFTQDGDDLVLARDPDALTWDYTIDCGCYLAIVCDTRTHRGYPIQGKLTAPPRLLSKSALETQITQVLDARLTAGKELLIVLSTNLFGLRALDWFHHQQIRRGKFFAADVGDAWNIRLDAVAELLDVIASNSPRAIVLTGDIHYAGAMDFRLQTNTGKSAQIVQFTASACKNEETVTKLVQSKLKSWLLPEFNRTCSGTFSPPRMEWHPLLLPFNRSNYKSDWQGKLRLAKYKSIELDRHILLTGSIGVRLGRKIRRCFYNGGEVVGFNNIAIVGWQQAERSAIVFQDVYWIDRAPTADFPLSIARYQIPLSKLDNR